MRRIKNMWPFIAILGVFVIAGCAVPLSYLGGGANGSGLGPALVNLRSAAGINGGSFAILAETTVTTTGATHILGDVGLSPSSDSSFAGFTPLTLAGTHDTAPQVNNPWVLYAAAMTSPTPSNMTTAINDMHTAYVEAAGRALPDYTELYSGDISGRTLAPGLYKWSTGVLINTAVTLSGGANDTWIFQIAQDLTNSASVILGGAAQGKNILWQVGGGTGVTLNSGSHLEGTVLAAKAITLVTGATVNGRLFAQSAVTLQANTITAP